MKKSLTTELNKVLETYIDAVNNQNINLIILNSNSSDTIKKIENNLLIKYKNKIKKSYFDMELHGANPYFPFLEIIKNGLEGYGEKEIVKYLKKNNVYNLHIDILKKYLTDNLTERSEDILGEEIFFERKKMKDEIKKMLTLKSDNKKYIYYLDNAEYMTESSLMLLEELLEYQVNNNITFVLSYRIEAIKEQEMRDMPWWKFLENVSDKINDIKIELDDDVKINKKKIEINIENAITNFSFFNISEAVAILQNLEDKFKEIKITEENIEYEKYLILSGKVYNFKGENDKALSYFHKYLNYTMKIKNGEKTADAYRLIGHTYYAKGEYEETLKSAYLGISFLEKENIIMKCRVYLVKMLALGELRYKYPEEFRKSYFEIEEELLKNRLYNIYLNITSMALVSNFVFDSFEGRLNACNKAIKIAAKMGNQSKLASLLHVKGIIYSSDGNTKDSFIYYKKSEKIKTEIGDKAEIVRILNGIGFGYFLAEKYKNAIIYFDKATGYVLEQKDYKELCVTIFNMAQVSFFTQNYHKSIEYIEKTLSIITILKYKEIPFHSISGINAMLALCMYKLGNYSKALECWNKAKSSIEYLKIDEILYFGLIEILLNKNNMKIEEIKEKQEYLTEYAKQNNLLYFIPMIYSEIGKIYNELGNKIESDASYKYGYNQAVKMGFNFHAENINKQINGKIIKIKPFLIKTRNINLRTIIEDAGKTLVLNTLQKRVNEISFLNNMQAIFMEMSATLDVMIERYVELIKNHFFIEKCYIFFYENGTWDMSYPEKRNVDKYKELLNEAIESKTDRIINGCNLEQYDIKITTGIVTPIIINDEIKGGIFFLSEQSDIEFNEEEAHILGIGTKQFTISLMNKRLQGELERLARTDGLTSMYNHKTIFENLEKEIERAERFKSKLSVIMLDIDYFKTINDRWGHAIGDKVLKRAAIEINKSIRGIDIAGRYGGEEFMVILPESGKDGAQVVAERIRKNIEALTFEEGLKVTISGGIAEYQVNQEITKFMETADKKLYEAKGNGRNRIEI